MPQQLEDKRSNLFLSLLIRHLKLLCTIRRYTIVKCKKKKEISKFGESASLSKIVEDILSNTHFF